jgi:competence protein ComEA
MNKREKLASVILVLTLAVGTIVDILGKRTDQVGLGGRAGSDSAAVIVTGGPDSVVPAAGAELAVPKAPADGAGEAVDEGSYRKIDLNKACLEELVLLPGIGPKKAEALLVWRAKNGDFKSLEDVLEVKGIGRGTLERLRPYATVGK